MSGLSKKNIGILATVVVVAGFSLGYGIYGLDEDVKQIETKTDNNLKIEKEDSNCAILFEKSKMLATKQNEFLTEANQTLLNLSLPYLFEPSKNLKSKLDMSLNNSNEVFNGIKSLKPGFIPFTDNPEVCVSKLTALNENSEKELTEAKSLLELVKKASENANFITNYSSCSDKSCDSIKELAFDSIVISQNKDLVSKISQVDMYSLFLFTDLPRYLTKLSNFDGELSNSCESSVKSYLDNYEPYIKSRADFENSLGKFLNNESVAYKQFVLAENSYNELTEKQQKIAKTILEKGLSSNLVNECKTTFDALNVVQNIDTGIFTSSAKSLEADIKASKSNCSESVKDCDSFVLGGIMSKQSESYTKEQAEEITTSINKIENAFAPPRVVSVKETKEIKEINK